MALTPGALSQTSVQAVGDILASAVAVSGTTPYTYQWYRSTSSGFTPGTATLISSATSLTLNDSGLSQATTYYYKVVVTDSHGTPVIATSAQLAVTTITAGTTVTREPQKLFGSSAATNQMARFGDLFASYPSVPTRYSGATITPTLVQALSNYLTGWVGASIGGNSPAIEDMNALCYLFSYQLYYAMQWGIPAWDASTTYTLGSLVQDGTSGAIYASLISNNLNGPVTSNVYWQRIARPSIGQQTSSSSGTFTTSSGSLTDVTNLTVTITTYGRPVMVFLTSDGTNNGSQVGIQATNASLANDQGTANFVILRDGSQIYLTSINLQGYSNTSTIASQIPPGVISFLDTPTAGSHTYLVQTQATSTIGSNVSSYAKYCVLVAYEL